MFEDSRRRKKNHDKTKKQALKISRPRGALDLTPRMRQSTKRAFTKGGSVSGEPWFKIADEDRKRD